MCGIAGYYCFGTERPDPLQLIEMWHAQEPRGRDAAGIAWRTPDGAISYYKNNEPVSKVSASLTDKQWEEIAQSPIGIMHARAHTKGSPSNPVNNHPVFAKNWLVVHNGVIGNDDDLVAYFNEERPAQVDTVAINMTLGRGGTLEESLQNLSVLDGSASIAAWNPDRPDQLIVARLNGPLFYWSIDREGRIIYFSSETAGLGHVPTEKFGALHFINYTAMPDRTAFVLEPSRMTRYQIPHNPFFRSAPEARRGANGKSGGTTLPIRAIPASTSDRSGHARTEIWTKRGSVEIVSIEDYTKLGKEEPRFEGVMARWWQEPGAVSVNESAMLPTPYGRWVRAGMTYTADRKFRPHKRVRTWFNYYNAIAKELPEIELPALGDLQSELAGVMQMERIYIRRDNTYHLGYMCPWCGIMSGRETWERWRYQCAWCRLNSYTIKTTDLDQVVIDVLRQRARKGEIDITGRDPAVPAVPDNETGYDYSQVISDDRDIPSGGPAGVVEGV